MVKEIIGKETIMDKFREVMERLDQEIASQLAGVSSAKQLVQYQQNFEERRPRGDEKKLLPSAAEGVPPHLHQDGGQPQLQQ